MAERYSDILEEILKGRPTLGDKESARRQGIEQGFAMAVRKIAGIVRQEGYTLLAERIAELKLVRK